MPVCSTDAVPQQPESALLTAGLSRVTSLPAESDGFLPVIYADQIRIFLLIQLNCKLCLYIKCFFNKVKYFLATYAFSV